MYCKHSQPSFIDFRTIFRTLYIQCVKLEDFYEVSDTLTEGGINSFLEKYYWANDELDRLSWLKQTFPEIKFTWGEIDYQKSLTENPYNSDEIFTGHFIQVLK